MPTAVNTRGFTVTVDSARRAERPSRTQILARRNDLWLHEHEVGRYDPVAGKPLPQPIWLIAALHGVTEKAVRNGLAKARELREAIANVDGLDT